MLNNNKSQLGLSYMWRVKTTDFDLKTRRRAIER